MVFLDRLCRLFVLLTVITASSARQLDSTLYSETLTLSYQPVTPASAASTPFATISYDPATFKFSLLSWSPPVASDSTPSSDTSSPLLRILSPSGSSSLVSTSALSPALSQDVDVWFSSDRSRVLSVSIRSLVPPPLSKEEEALRAREERLRARGKEVPPRPVQKKKPKKNKDGTTTPVVEEEDEGPKGPRVKVNLHVAQDGVKPKLLSRAPAQVDEQGREIAMEEVPEKTFFQKYWFVLLIGAFILMSSGGGKE